MYNPKKKLKFWIPLKWIGTLLVFTFISQQLSSQTCLPEGYKFTSQAELDAFAIDHPDCKEILGELIINETNGSNITHLGAFKNIEVFSSGLEIHGNQALENLQGFEKTKLIKGRLNIYFNQAMSSLEGIENLQKIDGSLRVSACPNLDNLKAFSNLTEISQDLSISSNPKLFNLKGLDNLETIGGYLIISSNTKMANFLGLEKLKSIGESFLIQDNPALLELSGSEHITTIGKNLIVENNSVLNSLQGLNSVQKVNGNLIIVNNSRLFDISALITLESINGLLQIFGNLKLISLSGLDNIAPEGIEDLALLSSLRLFKCDIESICAYLSDESNGAAIKQNAEGCSTREEILTACENLGEGINNNLEKSDAIFFPNPTSGKVEVKGRGVDTADLRIIDSYGRVLLTQKMEGTIIDLSPYPAGVYNLELQTISEIVVGRVIKIIE